MKKKFWIPGLLLGLFLVSCGSEAEMATPQFKDDQFRVIAYVTGAVIPENIPYDKLTHINYSFLIPNNDGSFVPLPNQWKLDKIVENAHAHGVRVLISVGGWGWDEEFETLAEDPKTRAKFVDELVAFVDANNLDGVDLDWEYPDPGQSSKNFLALVQETRAALGEERQLTTAVVASGDAHGLGIPVETFEIFNFINIMTYDAGEAHGTMDQYTGGLDYWRNRGLPEEKIVLGLPFYAHPDGTSFYKIVDAYPEAAEEDKFSYYGVQLQYNGISTIKEKTRIAMEEAGGVMFWTLEQDHTGEFSLLSAIDEVVKGEDQ